MANDRQLALVLFESLAPEGLTVEKAPTSLGFRRSNAFVQIVDLSLAGRRLLDVAYFLVAAEPEARKTYSVEYGLFKWLLGTTSDNRAHLKRLIREAQKAAIELNGGSEQSDSTQPWGAVPLMGPAYIAKGEFIFELADGLQNAIRDPQNSHFLSLRYVFKSIYSKILYDRLQPFIEELATPWFDLEALRVWLECDKQNTYSLFKHFKGRVLEPAMEEISEVTGLKVTMVTQNVPGSKKVGQVRFKWDANHKTEEKTAFVVLRNAYYTLTDEFGLNNSEIDEIIKNREEFTEDRIQQAMEYTRHQVNAHKVKLRVGGYFMKALRERYILGSLDHQIHERKATVERLGQVGENARSNREIGADRAFSARQSKESAVGWDAFKTLAVEDQQTLIREFGNLATSSLIARRVGIEISEIGEHLHDPAVKISFGTFVANKIHQAAKADKGKGSLNLFAAK